MNSDPKEAETKKNTEENPKAGDPLKLLSEWFSKAEKTESSYPDAMSLATLGEDGFPDVRVVLLKHFDAEGFVFYTNYEGKKARDLAHCDKAGLCLYWKETKRQVRVSGVVTKVSAEESDVYFASRARASQLGAWASRQSRPMADEFELERQVAKYTLKFNIGAIPRPENWGGYRMVARSIEFWEERTFRLHRRQIFTRETPTELWKQQFIFP